MINRPKVQRGAARLPSLKGHDVYSPRWKMRDTRHIYVYLDAERRPLYVGQSLDIQTRNSDHHRLSDWYPLAVEFRVLWSTADRAEALLAEAKAIRVLAPLFNVAHNRRRAA